MTSAIALVKLSKSFGKKQAVSELDLTVKRGEIFGFLGPNGAGKTTTVRLIMDFIRPTSGSAKVFGKDSSAQATEIKTLVGYLPSDQQMYGEWNGQQHLRFLESIRGNLAWKQELIERLKPDLSTKVKNLSSGNKQKLSILLASAHKPKLLILDEPTKGLDPLLQHTLYELLDDYRDGGGTVFISSHNLDEVQRLCDQVGIIKDGRLVTHQSIEGLRAIASQLVEISFRSPINHNEFIMENVTIMHSSKNSLSLKVHGDINPLIKKLASYNLRSITVTPLNLEDIFLDYYREPSK